MVVFARVGLAALGIVLATVMSAEAHVNLLAPTGGEGVEVGDAMTIEWAVHIEHDTLNWDLWYSTVGSDGPWVEIAQDIPADCVTAGCMYEFPWTVPADAEGSDLWIRVRQDNSGGDYNAVNETPVVVQSDVVESFFMRGDVDGNGSISIADTIRILNELFDAGAPEQECQAAFDTNADEAIDLSDGVFLLTYLFNGGAAPSAPFPVCGPSLEETLTCAIAACP